MMIRFSNIFISHQVEFGLAFFVFTSGNPYETIRMPFITSLAARKSILFVIFFCHGGFSSISNFHDFRGIWACA